MICAGKDQLKSVMNWQQIYQLPNYKIQAVYKEYMGVTPQVTWYDFVWNMLNIPKHRFICWLMIQRRLHTAEFLNKIGVVALPHCLLCGDDVESHSHMFFNCYFSKYVLSLLMDWVQINTQCGSVMDVVQNIKQK